MSIHQKMAAILAAFPAVTKDRQNPSQGYKYRGIDDALRELNPLLSKHGVYIQLVDLVPTFSEAGQTKAGAKQTRCSVVGKVRFVSGEDGSFTECSLIGEGIDTGDKAMMKAQANGLKYTLWYTFCVPTDEKKDSEAFEDPESEGGGGGGAKRTRAKKTDGAKHHAPVNGTPRSEAAPSNVIPMTQPVQPSTETQLMLSLIAGCKTKDELLGIRQQMRDWCKDRPGTDPERQMVVDNFVARQNAFGA